MTFCCICGTFEYSTFKSSDDIPSVKSRSGNSTDQDLYRASFFLHSEPDFPEQECPEYGHYYGETSDNRTTDQRINL